MNNKIKKLNNAYSRKHILLTCYDNGKIAYQFPITGIKSFCGNKQYEDVFECESLSDIYMLEQDYLNEFGETVFAMVHYQHNDLFSNEIVVDFFDKYEQWIDNFYLVIRLDEEIANVDTEIVIPNVDSEDNKECLNCNFRNYFFEYYSFED